MDTTKTTPVQMTSEEGVELTVMVPTDVISVLSTLQPGEDFAMKLTGFSQEQLQSAFTSVQNKENWKFSILSFCAEKDQNLISRAIEYFTGSVASFEFLSVAVIDQPEKNILVGDRILVVRAAGYYSACGA